MISASIVINDFICKTTILLIRIKVFSNLSIDLNSELIYETSILLNRAKALNQFSIYFCACIEFYVSICVQFALNRLSICFFNF